MLQTFGYWFVSGSLQRKGRGHKLGITLSWFILAIHGNIVSVREKIVEGLKKMF